MQVGDVIQAVGGDLVQNVCGVRQAIAKRGCGDVRLTIRRGVDTMAVDVHLADASRFHRKKGLCQDGDGAACTAMAKEHNDVVLLRNGCDLGDGEGCFLLGLALKTNDPKGSVAAYEQACDAGHSLACTNLGWMIQNGLGARVDVDAARRLFQRGCDGSACTGRNNLGCVNVGRLDRDGIGVKADHPRALQIFRDVCGRTPRAGDAEDAGNIARACSLAGTDLIWGKELTHDIPEGLALLEKGCTRNDSFGCFNLGAAYEDGEVVPKDTTRAGAYYKRACDGGDDEACQRLASLAK